MTSPGAWRHTRRGVQNDQAPACRRIKPRECHRSRHSCLPTAPTSPSSRRLRSETTLAPTPTPSSMAAAAVMGSGTRAHTRSTLPPWCGCYSVSGAIQAERGTQNGRTTQQPGVYGICPRSRRVHTVGCHRQCTDTGERITKVHFAKKMQRMPLSLPSIGTRSTASAETTSPGALATHAEACKMIRCRRADSSPRECHRSRPWDCVACDLGPLEHSSTRRGVQNDHGSACTASPRGWHPMQFTGP